MSRFVISCGGTGGHLAPGIALAQALQARGHATTLLISRKKVDSRLIEKYPDLRFETMPGAGFSLRPLRLLRFLTNQAAALRFCMRLTRSERPDAIIGFGGFTSAPGAVAGTFRSIPVVLHEANRVPGLAVRMLSRLARRVYLPPGVSIAGLRSDIVRSAGLPVRSEMVRQHAATARAALGMDPRQRLLVVLGGSQGASALNVWVRKQLPLLASEGIQVYCVTGLGKGDAEVVKLQGKSGSEVKAAFVPFSDRMEVLLSAADLVLTRAGAGTLAELVRCEAPAIVVPYPHAASDHQRANASFFERQGGGVVVEEQSMGALHLEVLDLIFNDALLKQLRANLRRMDLSNSLGFMIGDLEEIVSSPRSESSSRSKTAVA